MQHKVLITEDETFNINILVDILKPKYKLSIVKDGLRSLETVRKVMPDLILLDVMLPGKSGYEICQELKQDETTASIPVIFMTARNSPEDIVYGLNLGAADYIVKPINYMELLSRIKNHISLADYIKELEKLNEDIDRLSGILPMCPRCHKVRKDDGYWHKVDAYLSDVSDMDFTHGICPDCMEKLYPDLKGKRVQRHHEVKEEEPIAKPGILIIEDENFNITLLSDLLKEDYEITVARDGAEGLKMLAENTIDLILLDILMVGMDGYEVCEKIKSQEKYRDIPVLFMTVKRETNDIIRAFQVGAVDYITKPIQYDELLARVRTQIAIRQTILELKHARTMFETLSGMIPICSNCQKIRTDQGFWQNVEDFFSSRTKLKFEKSLCPDCRRELGSD